MYPMGQIRGVFLWGSTNSVTAQLQIAFCVTRTLMMLMQFYSEISFDFSPEHEGTKFGFFTVSNLHCTFHWHNSKTFYLMV